MLQLLGTKKRIKEKFNMLRPKDELCKELDYLKGQLGLVQGEIKGDPSQKNLDLSHVLTGKINIITSEIEKHAAAV